MLWTFNPESKVRFLMGEHNILLTPNFNVMRKVISLIKRGAKAYFRQVLRLMLGHLQELFQLEYSSFDAGVNNKYYMG